MNALAPPLTWLYVPGDRPDRYAKAVASGADAVILDLEDAVAAAHKADARTAAAEFLDSAHPVPVHVRVSGELTADLAAVAGRPGLAGVRLPKVESAAQVRAVAELLGEAGALRERPVELHCVIESAVGVEAAYQIAAAHPWVRGIGLGEADLGADLNVADEAGLTWARSRIVVAARAAGLPPPAMSVYPHVNDMAGLVESCAQGRRLGFLGRAAIHPQQLPVIVAAFLPAPEEVAQARALLDALAHAEQRDSGTAVLPDGRFADRAMAAAAERTVALAARCGGPA